METKIKFHYGAGGALVTDEPMEGVTQELDGDTAKYYGGRYFVAESMTRGAAQRLAALLGGRLKSIEEEWEEMCDELRVREERLAMPKHNNLLGEKKKKLESLLEQSIAQKSPDSRAKAYGKLFDLAAEMGDFPLAQQYLNKALEAMVEQMRLDSKNAENQTP